MTRIAIAGYVLATLLLLSLLSLFALLVWRAFLAPQRPVEGFDSDKPSTEARGTQRVATKSRAPRIPSAENVLVSLVNKLKRISTSMSNPAEWIERIELSNLSATDLARRHLKASRPSE
jgi:hypothetical protein